MRVIARLDIKGSHLIKGRQFEGYRKLGDPREFSLRYAEQGVDELLFVDNVASLYGSAPMLETLRRVTEDVFIPITVAGGIDSVEKAHLYLRNGADKVAVNTAALSRPSILRDIAEEIGSQSVVSSLEVKRSIDNSVTRWECLGNTGRDHSGRFLADWIQEVESMGVGELLITSIDHDGMLGGFDSELRESVKEQTNMPLVFSGGISSKAHVLAVSPRPQVDGVAVGTSLHTNLVKVSDLRVYEPE